MYFLHIVYKIRKTVLQIHVSRVKTIVVSKFTNFIFCREKEQVMNVEMSNLYLILCTQLDKLKKF